MIENVPNNFGGLAEDFSNYEKSKIVILPIPFDETSTWGKGANKGPAAIIEASQNMELYDIETISEVYKKGIWTTDPIVSKQSELMIAEALVQTKKFLNDKKFVVSLGGEHSVSIGPIRACAEKYPDLSILHLDAHSDRRDIYDDSKYNHACVIARAAEMVNNIVSVGIRSVDSSELKSFPAEKMFFAEKIIEATDWIEKIIDQLSNEVYITIDLDVFDPSIVPATGTPEPGGLAWYPVLKLLKAVVDKKEVVGLDVVELAPNPTEKSSDFLAAKLIYKILSYKFNK